APDRPWEATVAQLGVLDSWNAVFEPRRAQFNSASEHCLVAGTPADARAQGLARLPPKPTPTIDRMGRDLTRLAAEGRLDPVIGRDAEIRQLASALLRKSKRNAMLIGEAGVGKTAIVEGLAVLATSGALGSQFDALRICEISIGDLIAG